MAVWQFLKAGRGHAWNEEGVAVSTFDDGLAYMPGEDGFSREAADAKAKALGAGVSAYLVSVPGWHARIESEQRKAAAEAEIDALLNPAMPADAVNAKYDALLAAAPEREADIKQLREAELKALE